MSIPDRGVWDKEEGAKGLAAEHIWALLERTLKDPLLVAAILLTASLCFGLGLIAERENKSPGDQLWIEQLSPEELPGSVSTSTNSQKGAESVPASAPSPAPSSPSFDTSQPAAVGAAVLQQGAYVASKTGSKYYLPSCSGAKRIKDENKIWFATKAAAQAAGYSPSSTCKGL